jgi:hypothetical protein
LFINDLTLKTLYLFSLPLRRKLTRKLSTVCTGRNTFADESIWLSFLCPFFADYASQAARWRELAHARISEGFQKPKQMTAGPMQMGPNPITGQRQQS